jgi:hypothetical protein
VAAIAGGAAYSAVDFIARGVAVILTGADTVMDASTAPPTSSLPAAWRVVVSLARKSAGVIEPARCYHAGISVSV